MSDIYTVDRQVYHSLSQSERDRITDELRVLGVFLSDTREAYTDESGKVVGALRYVRDDGGKLVVRSNDVVVESVGVTP